MALNTAAHPPDGRKKVHQDEFVIQIAKAARVLMDSCPRYSVNKTRCLRQDADDWSSPDINNNLIDNRETGAAGVCASAALEEMEMKTNTARGLSPVK